MPSGRVEAVASTVHGVHRARSEARELPSEGADVHRQGVGGDMPLAPARLGELALADHSSEILSEPSEERELLRGETHLSAVVAHDLSSQVDAESPEREIAPPCRVTSCQRVDLSDKQGRVHGRGRTASAPAWKASSVLSADSGSTSARTGVSRGMVGGPGLAKASRRSASVTRTGGNSTHEHCSAATSTEAVAVVT